MNYIEDWFEILSGKQSNWQFFVDINSGWLEMEYQYRYGSDPSEKDQWEWMFLNAERIELSTEDYDTLWKRLAEPSDPAMIEGLKELLERKPLWEDD